MASGRRITFKRLPRGIRRAATQRLEAYQRHAPKADLLLREQGFPAKRRESVLAIIESGEGTQRERVERFAHAYRLSSRTIYRWLKRYRDGGGAAVSLQGPRGPRIGGRRLTPLQETVISDAIDAWIARLERLPIAWLIEECARRCKADRVPTVSRNTIVARLRDRGIESLNKLPQKMSGKRLAMPRPTTPLELVQIDHTMVDIMVVDDAIRESIGRPWVTIVFDVATRVVLGFLLSLAAPSATSVGLAISMAGLPKDRWLKDHRLKLRWVPYGIPKVLHLDNAAEFHSVALKRGCERYGIRLEYRPPGRPQYGGHIERYLGTLMRQIHGLPGTTMSNPQDRGRYPSEAKACMTMAELERWMALEIDGKYHQRPHRGLHAIPAQAWQRQIKARPSPAVPDAARFLIDFLPAEMRRVTKNGFQLGRIRYWDPLLSQLYLAGTRVLVRYDPRDLSKVYVSSTGPSGYLDVPYADLRYPPITLAERERARKAASESTVSVPTEADIFKAVSAQRQIEDSARKRTRRSRRNVEMRPKPNSNKRPGGAKVDYRRKVIPYKGENW